MTVLGRVELAYKVSSLQRIAAIVVMLMLTSMAVVPPASANPPVPSEDVEQNETWQKSWVGTNIQIQEEIAQEIARANTGDKLYISIFWVAAYQSGKAAPMQAALMAALDRGVDIDLLTEGSRFNKEAYHSRFINNLYAHAGTVDGTFRAKACGHGCESTSGTAHGGKNHEKFIYAELNGPGRRWDGDSGHDFAISSTANWLVAGPEGSGSRFYEAAMMFNVDHYAAVGTFLKGRFDGMWDNMSVDIPPGATTVSLPATQPHMVSFNNYNDVYTANGTNAGAIDWGADPDAQLINWVTFIDEARGGGCQIRMVMGSADWSDRSRDVVDALRRAKKRGCFVNVVFFANAVSGKKLIQRSEAPATSTQAPFGMELQWRTGRAHAKLLLIEAPTQFDDRVWIGSANVTDNVVEKNDEITFRSEDNEIFEHVKSFFRTIERAESGCEDAAHFGTSVCPPQ